MAAGKYRQWQEPAQLERLTNWAANGCTDSEIIANMGIGRTTFYRWLESYEDIRDAIKRGRELSCEVIENALFRRAVGMTVTETVEEFRGEVRDGKPANGTVVKKEVTRTIPPDTGAVIFYLKNRMSDRYADRRETKVDVAAPTIALGIEPARAAQ